MTKATRIASPERWKLALSVGMGWTGNWLSFQ
jgi:hypothetical protein